MLRIESVEPEWPNTLVTLFPRTGGANDVYPVEVMGSMVEVLHGTATHKYLGDLKGKSKIENSVD